MNPGDCTEQILKPIKTPTGMIAVDEMEDFSEVHLCSCSSNASVRYVTLSHCWGLDGLDLKIVLDTLPHIEILLYLNSYFGIFRIGHGSRQDQNLHQ